MELLSGEELAVRGRFSPLLAFASFGKDLLRSLNQCQRSFNWQSTAFVMRGLRVRFPPLALGIAFRPK